jgi:glycosyltransferase involved in cell wall biosynthesis
MAGSGAPLVSIGIPLYRSQRFVDRVIRNIAAIDCPSIEVIVSDRHCHDDALDLIADRFGNDPRVRTIKAIDRLTWVEHYNLLLRSASGTYFMWMPHDDEFPATWVSRLVAELEAHPEAVLAYGRIERVDLDRHLRKAPDDLVAGDERSPSADTACALLIERRTEPPFRGVFRRAPVIDGGLSIRASRDNVSADVYWVFGLALLGSFRYVPACVCRKFYYAESTHAQWGPMRTRHIVNGRRVLLSYVRAANLDRHSAGRCTTAVNRWAALAIAGVVARRCRIPSTLRRSAERFLSRTLATGLR